MGVREHIGVAVDVAKWDQLERLSQFYLNLDAMRREQPSGLHRLFSFLISLCFCVTSWWHS